MILTKSDPSPDEIGKLLNIKRLPAVLSITEAGALLGRNDLEMSILIAAKMLTPLGKPARTAPKKFAAIEILNLFKDRDWHHKAHGIISKHWADKNARKNTHQ